MQLSKEILRDIADNLEAGFKCFIHKDTHEVIAFLDQDCYPETETELQPEEIEIINKDPEKYIEIERMNSTEGFRVMEEFIASLATHSTKVRLLKAIAGSKPFAAFNSQIDNSGEYRQLWFDFRKDKIVEWVQDQLSAVHH